MSTPIPYLDLAGFKLRTTMPSGDVDLCESDAAGFIETQIAMAQEYIENRLRKRYEVPFAAPVPGIVLRWLTHMVTHEAYDKRGRDPQDPAMQTAKEKYDQAIAEIREAADSKDGAFDLPLRADLQTSAVVNGGPLSYAEQSPYTWATKQGCAGREEDANGGP